MIAGLNCALGARALYPYVESLAGVADTLVATHPNAGLPNDFGGYDDTPEQMAATLEIDAVIDPADTRSWLSRGIAGVRVQDPGWPLRFVDTW